ncbi:MAG TPA: isoprenylcysteine carboxylmethyltransferase family protein [Gemmatimonadaceae bacterium]|nr:isoprenylcysteine carboxylmethyltransferase family protein [Gemmatimonadaceae bacterium]
MGLFLRVLSFTVLLPCSILAWIPYYWIAGPSRVGAHWPPAATDALALTLIAAGAVVYVTCAWRFATEGSGTPAPWDPPRRLVTGGLYRWVRNPMYVGIPVALLGEAWWLHSRAMLIYAAFVLAAFHLRVILYEEPKLRELFGAEFDAYAARVKRWGLF